MQIDATYGPTAIGIKVLHNMHPEALRVIKHVHLQGRKVQRLDKSIHGFLKHMEGQDEGSTS